MNKGLAALAILLIGSTFGHALEVSFDTAADGATHPAAPDTFGEVLASPTAGPHLSAYSTLGITFDGGVILSGALFHNTSNLLATSDFAYIQNDLPLPGSITIVFDRPTSAVGMRIVNGYSAADFALAADTGEVVSIHLGDYMTVADSAYVVLRGAAMNSVTVSSTQPAGNRIFGIDNVSATPVPEPSTLSGIIAGTALALRAARRLR